LYFQHSFSAFCVAATDSISGELALRTHGVSLVLVEHHDV
jgi:hypothetical protein